jgi:hypothetical protein
MKLTSKTIDYKTQEKQSRGGGEVEVRSHPHCPSHVPAGRIGRPPPGRQIAAAAAFPAKFPAAALEAPAGPGVFCQAFGQFDFLNKVAIPGPALYIHTCRVKNTALAYSKHTYYKRPSHMVVYWLSTKQRQRTSGNWTMRAGASLSCDDAGDCGTHAPLRVNSTSNVA